MKFIYILLFVAAFISCKRKREISVDGVVTDAYNGAGIYDATVRLTSQIETGVSGGTFNVYESTTNSSGYFSFEHAAFSKPGNSGYVRVTDPGYEDADFTTTSDETIDGTKEIKFLGKTKLSKNLSVISLSQLNTTLNISPAIHFSFARFYLKFSGPGNIPAHYRDFLQTSQWSIPQKQYDFLPKKLLAYPDGINIIKTEYYDLNSQTFKFQYDTIVSPGPAAVTNYTINLN